MYIKVTDTGTIYPYTDHMLRASEPDTSFPDVMPAELLAQYGVYTVLETPKPESSETTAVYEGDPVFDGEKWLQTWKTTAATVEMLKQLRAEAYRLEADPVFFKWQRGEATQQDWLDKVAEIAARYPY